MARWKKSGRYSTYREPKYFKIRSNWLREPPGVGSYDAVEEVLTSNRTSATTVGGVAAPTPRSSYEDAATRVKAMLDSGHGVSMVEIRGLGVHGGREEGAASAPTGLPVVLSTLRSVPRRQPECGVIDERDMKDAIRRAGLTETERAVLLERLGIGMLRQHVTQRVLAEMRGVSQQAISATEKRARQKVRAVLEADGFAGFERRIGPGVVSGEELGEEGEKREIQTSNGPTGDGDACADPLPPANTVSR